MRMHSAMLAVGLTCGAALISATPDEEKPHWHKDWPTAQRLAKQGNKPILAVLVCQH